MGIDASATYKKCFDLIYHSNGGFTWGDIKKMPTAERDLFYKFLVERKTEENKPHEDGQPGQDPSGKNDIMRVPFAGETYGVTDEDAKFGNRSNYLNRMKRRQSPEDLGVVAVASSPIDRARNP